MVAFRSGCFFCPIGFLISVVSMDFCGFATVWFSYVFSIFGMFPSSTVFVRLRYGFSVIIFLFCGWVIFLG